MKDVWYKTAAEQESFGFAKDDSTLEPSPKLYHSYKSRDTLESLMDESTGYLAVESNLIKFDYKWRLVKFPSGDRVVVVQINNDTYIVDDFVHPSVMEVHDWLYMLGMDDLEGYYPDTKFSTGFWRTKGNLYHGTTEEGAVGILENGLEPKAKSRGIENRNMGTAVFMSDNPEEPAYYYPVVLEINVTAMHADGFMPEMVQETPVREAELRDAVANAIGLSEFQSEYEAGISPTTVICTERIPPKYIRRIP